jgi:Putative Flp pilus-assembly TadE/G-like
MSALYSRIRSESGQVLIFVILILIVLIGMAAVVIDVGSMYRAQRHAQTAADAAALAGAQELPLDPPLAESVARDYGKENYSAAAFHFPEPPNDYTIDVKATGEMPGIFIPALERLFGSDTVHDTLKVHAEAQAQVQAPLELKNVAPIAVKESVACIVDDPSCFGPDHTVTVGFDESNIASSLIGLINIECNSDLSGGCGPGQTGGDELREWIKCDPCYDDALPSNKWYGVKTGVTAGPIRQGLEYAAATGMTLFFPVFDKSCPGDPSCASSDKSFHIIGWAAFVIDPDGVNWQGGQNQPKELTGHFVTFIATELASGGTGGANFGVQVITLTK